MSTASEQCAREVMDTVPLVMRFIRCRVRRQPGMGLALPQFRALAFLSRVKDPSLSATAEHLGLVLPAMSRLADGLVRRGWVARRPVASNRRQLALALTAAGRAKLEKMRAVVRRQLADRLDSLPATDRDTVRRAMEILRGAFEAQPAEPARTSGKP